MKIKDERKLIAPCGLYCGTCTFYNDSEIRKTAVRLKQLLDGFEYVAKIFEQDAPALKDYPEFLNVLKYISKQDCLGCRFGGGKESGAACMPLTCPMLLCTIEKGLDFCYQCTEFPCEMISNAFKDTANKGLIDIWINSNNRMKKIGLDRYLEEKKKEQRYNANKPD